MLDIIIVDDHAIVRRGLVQILEIEESLSLKSIDEAESGIELLEKARKKDYDLVILDISMPGMGGLETLKELKSYNSDIPVLVLSTHREEEYAIRMLKAGASGYIRKSNRPEELVKAINQVSQGKKYFSPQLAEKLFEMDEQKLPHELLSDREFEILKMIAIGKTQKEISEELYLSIKTISTYRRRVLDKMDLTTNEELIAYARSHNLIGE